MTTRFNPYTDLKQRFMEWVYDALGRKRRVMWVYPKASVDAGESWPLVALAQRVQAAQQLGHTVELRWDDARGLIVEYVAPMPQRPWDI